MFKSNRKFKLWDYRVSHHQLLIRSPSTPNISTNVDVVFWGVEFVLLPTSFHGLEIVRVASTKDTGVEFSPSTSGEVFLIDTDGRKVVVVAAGCKVLENSLDIFESSLERFAATDTNRDLGDILAHS